METVEYKGYNIKIEQDYNVENPRDWDTLGTILYTSDRYLLGDEQVDAETIQEIIDDKNNIVLPVYAYIHGNVVLNTTGYHCPWDSGQCGIIYVSKDDVRKKWNVQRISKKIMQIVLSNLRAEVEIFSDYLSGNVYWYEVTDPDGKWIDSCGGFFGFDFDVNGLMENAKSVIDYDIKQREQFQNDAMCRVMEY